MEMQALLSSEEYRDVKESELTWSQRLRKEGRDEGMRSAVLAICELLGIEMTTARRAHVERAEGAALTNLMEALTHQRAWPPGE